MRIGACLAVVGIIWCGLAGALPPRPASLDRADAGEAQRIADRLVRRGPEAASEAPAVLRCVERLVAGAQTPVEFRYYNPCTEAFWQNRSNDRDEVLQRAAGRVAGALPHLGEPGFAFTVAALKHPLPRVRAAMLAALRERGFPPQDYPWPDLGPLAVRIGALLDDPDRSVRFVALVALATLPREDAVLPQVAALTRSPDDEIARTARHVVDGDGWIAREVHLSTLERPGVNESDRLTAATSLGDDPAALEAAAPVVRASLASRDPRIRDRARTEGGIQFRSWTDAQRTAAFGAGALEVPPPRPRSVASGPPTTAALEMFRRFFGPRPFQRAGAARLAGLSERLRAPDPAVRLEAAREAWRIGPDAAPLVGQLAEHVAVSDALPWLAHDTAYERQAAEQSARALARIGAAGFPALVRVLAEGDAGARCLAVKALAEMQRAAAPALPLVIPQLASPYPALRAAALGALAQLSADDALVVRAACRAVTDPDRDVRMAAVHALAPRARVPGALPGLFQAVADRDRWLAERAREALASVGPVVR